MKIGLLGGSFDPVHSLHIMIAYQAYQQLSLDEVWFIPVLNNPFGKKSTATKEQRVDMLTLAIKKYPMFKISMIELEQDSSITSYTYDTILQLKAEYPKNEFFFIIGFDQVASFNRWYKANEISKEATVVAFPRTGYEDPLDNVTTYRMQYLDIPTSEASSSSIRKGDLSSVPTDVIHYFVMHGIYLETIIQNKMSIKRYEHTKSVAALAKLLAKANHYDATKAYVTAMLHDIAKELDLETSKRLMRAYYPLHMHKPKNLWHQWLGSYIAENEYKIKDEEILHAIEVHTTAAIEMSVLDKIIYVADKVVPTRNYDSNYLIQLAMKDIHLGFKETLRKNTAYLIKNNVVLDNNSKKIYKKYVEESYE